MAEKTAWLQKAEQRAKDDCYCPTCAHKKREFGGDGSCRFCGALGREKHCLYEQGVGEWEAKEIRRRFAEGTDRVGWLTPEADMRTATA